MDEAKQPNAAPKPQRTPGQQVPGAGANQPRVQMFAPPTNAADVEREKERVGVLLEINRELASHLAKLQADGHGGLLAPQAQSKAQAQAQSPTTQGPQSGAGPGSVGGTPPVTPTTSSKMAAPEYIRCMRSMQCNIQYLLATSGAPARAPEGPAFMEPPYAAPRIVELYDKLKTLFPGWRGLQAVPQAIAQAQAARKASGDSGQSGAGVTRAPAAGGQLPPQVPVQTAAVSTSQAGPAQRMIQTPPGHTLSGVQPPMASPGLDTLNQQNSGAKTDGQEAIQGQRAPSEGNGMTSGAFMQSPT